MTPEHPVKHIGELRPEHHKVLKQAWEMWPPEIKQELQKRNYRSLIGDVKDASTRKQLHNEILQNNTNEDVKQNFENTIHRGMTRNNTAFTPYLATPKHVFNLGAHEHGHLLHNLLKEMAKEPSSLKKYLQSHLLSFNEWSNKEKPIKISETYRPEKHGNETFAELHKNLKLHILNERNKNINYVNHLKNFVNVGKTKTHKIFGNMLLMLLKHIAPEKYKGINFIPYENT